MREKPRGELLAADVLLLQGRLPERERVHGPAEGALPQREGQALPHRRPQVQRALHDLQPERGERDSLQT